MKSRILFVALSLIAGIAAIGLLFATADYTGSAVSPFTFANKAATRDGSAIRVSRAFTIPYGIEDTLKISADGQFVTVTGHGDCVGGESFRLRATLRQDSFNGLAIGHTEGLCSSDGLVEWSAQVNTPGSKTFSAGPALACGHVVVNFDHQGAISHDWCKSVTLE